MKSVKVYAIVSIVFKRYPSTYFMQGSSVICSNFQNLKNLPQNKNHNL